MFVDAWADGRHFRHVEVGRYYGFPSRCIVYIVYMSGGQGRTQRRHFSKTMGRRTENKYEAVRRHLTTRATRGINTREVGRMGWSWLVARRDASARYFNHSLYVWIRPRYLGSRFTLQSADNSHPPDNSDT